jgi:predicted RNase H-like nuclease
LSRFFLDDYPASAVKIARCAGVCRAHLITAVMTLTGGSKHHRQDAGRPAIQVFPAALVTTPHLDRQATMRRTS